MIHRQRRSAGAYLGYRGKRDQRAVRACQIQLGQGCGILLKLRQQFQHHFELIGRGIDDRYLLPAERGAERGFDLTHRHPQRRSAVTIDRHMDRRGRKI